MILGNAAAGAKPPPERQRLTVDEIFRRIALGQPDRPALADAPNRAVFTDGAPRRLTYAQADRTVTAIADRLRRMELPADSIVGIQLPNIAENVLTLLGVLRAGLIAAPLPLLWRRADAVAALSRVGAKALITCKQVGGFDHCQFAMRVASEVFSIRYVCAFGPSPHDGVVPFDDLFTAEPTDPAPDDDRDRLGAAAAHLALITFDVGEGGIVPVARNHRHMLAGGLAVTLESQFAQGATVLSTIAPSSFAGVTLTLLSWLLSAGTLVLHHPFDAAVLAQQCRDEKCGTLIAPGEVMLRLAEAGSLTREGPGAPLDSVVATWRAPECMAASRTWRQPQTALIDVPVFGEAGLLAARRGVGGRAEPLPLGPVAAPRGNADGVVVAELVVTATETAALRGPMVPRHAFPLGIERSGLPHFKIERSGLVDTGYRCRIDSGGKAIVITTAPRGIVGIGGYRLPIDGLREVVRRIDKGATLTALPDPLTGARLIGNAADRAVVRAALDAVGANPLVTAAFRENGGPEPVEAGREPGEIP